MSTRSFIGFTRGDGFRARYCHSSGYPTWMGHTLWRLLKETCHDDVSQLIKTITREHYGWSCLDPDLTELYSMYEGDARFLFVPGWGIAYTDTVIPNFPGLPGQPKKPYQQIRKTDWIVFDDKRSDTWDTAFGYIFDVKARTLNVFAAGPLRLLGTFSLDRPEPDWAAVEAAAYATAS